MARPRQYSSKRSNSARKTVAAQLPAPCTICSRVVLPEHNWQADHITPRAVAEAQGWTAAEIDSASNLGASHASCNARSGQALGNALKAQAKAEPRRVPRVARPQLSFSGDITNTPAVAPQIPSPAGLGEAL
jgi:hypothetical protein